MKRKHVFSLFAKHAARMSGQPLVFLLAFLVVFVWAISGPFFHFNDTWQLTINTGTTIVTFLMVFLIQNTQNRDTEALQLKLDELIRAMEGAHNALLDIEELTEEDLDRIKVAYSSLAKTAREALRKGKGDTAHPEVFAHGKDIFQGKD